MVFLHDLGIFVQALPIFLDKMFNEWVAVILSVTFVLAFGEVGFLLSLINFSLYTYDKLSPIVGISC